MTSRAENADQSEVLDVRGAAALVRRHPETVRRWVWSGRLAARREGGRLVVARRDVEALAGRRAVAMTLAEWAERARSARGVAKPGAGTSAADLVIEDRAQRSGPAATRAGR